MDKTFFQKAGQNKHTWYKIGDRLPPLELQLIRTDDGSYYDISAGSGTIEIEDADGSYIISGSSVSVASGATGKAHYYPAAGDFALSGTYDIKWKIDALGTGAILTAPEYPYEYKLRID